MSSPPDEPESKEPAPADGEPSAKPGGEVGEVGEVEKRSEQPVANDESLPVALRKPRGALGRDLLRWFLIASIALHVSTIAPWAKAILAIGRIFHKEDDLWNEKKVDHPTVIPIDLDSLDDSQMVATNNGQGDDGFGPNAHRSVDGGVDDASTDADGLAADAAHDGALADVGGDAASGDAGPGRVPDPSKAAGGVLALKPVKGEVNVSILFRTDHMRAHPLGAAIGARISLIQQWRGFLEGTAIDPVNDLDAIFADGPRFYETSRVTTILIHSKSDQIITDALNAIAKNHADAKWIGGDQVEALAVKLEDADRVLVEIPGGLIITPPDGKQQALDIATAMKAKGKTGHDLLPTGDTDLLFVAYMRNPSNVVKTIPADLIDTHITVRVLPDQGIAVDADTTAKSATSAVDDAEVLRKFVDSRLTGFKGALIKRWVVGYTLSTSGNVVKLHHQLTGDDVSDIWTLVQTFGL